MTYGFKFLNDLGETVIDDSNVKPWFYGQAPVINVVQLDTQSFANLLSQTDGDGNAFSSFVPQTGIVSWAVYLITYQVPASYNTFIMLNLPNTTNNVFYTCPNPVTLAGYTTVSVYAYVPNTVIGSAADIPKAYIFAADPIPTSQKSTGYGIQVFNQSSECMYDSGKRHLQAAQFPEILVRHLYDLYTSYNPPETPYGQLNLNNNYSMPSNPAWLLPALEILWVYPDYANGPWYMTRIPVLYKKQYNYSNLLVAQPRTYKQSTSPSPDIAGLFGNSQLYATRLSGSGGDSYSALPSVVIDATPLDQGYTPPELPQSYILTKTKPGITESTGGLYGTDVISITLTTTGVPNGTVVPYTITGISASDLTSGTLTGNFGIINNSAVAYFTATNDSLTEGTETATLALNNGKASISFTISDAVTYALSSYMSPEEGQSIAVTLTTGGLANGSTVPYTVTGITSGDLIVGSLTGNFTVSNNTSTLEFRFAKDGIDDYETMHISVNNGLTYLDIPITNVPYANEILTISPANVTANQNTIVTITGGYAYDKVEFITLDQGVDPVYAWNNRWKPEYASLVGVVYLDENGSYFNNPIGSSYGIGNKTLWIFTDTSKNFRSANITVGAEPTFSITGTDGTKGPLTVNEGTTGYFKVTTTNIANGTVVYPKLIGGSLSSNDYTNTAASGVAIQNGLANFQITFTADQTTEFGSEDATLVVQYPNGTTKDTYGVITVNDSSLTPATYSLTRSVPASGVANEGTAAYFYLTTNQSTDLYWTLNGTGITTDDIVAAGAYDADNNYYSYGPDTSGIINQNYYQLFVYFKSDLKTEGAETLTVNIRTGSPSGTIVASATVVISDTSVYPAAGTPSGNPFCIGYDKYQTYNDGSGGTYTSMIEANSSYCGYITYNETLTITSDANGNYIVPLNGYMSIVISNGAPSTVFNYAITNNSDPQPGSFPGSATLDEFGNWSNYITGATAQGGQTIGDKRLWVKFAYNQHVRSARFQVVYDSGTPSGGQYCSGTTLMQNYHNGAGGTYSQTVQVNSPTCGYIQQYYPYMSAGSYWYYNVDYVHQLWYIYDAKPNSTVKFTIVAGPNYVGANASITVDGNGYGSYDIGNAPYTAGTYTINATFPGNDASYPTNYRTLVFYWVVYAGSGGGGGY